MHTFKAAQPALLYLSPACILSVLAVAAARGEVSQLWSYNDGDEEEEDKKKSSDENGAVRGSKEREHIAEADSTGSSNAVLSEPRKDI